MDNTQEQKVEALKAAGEYLEKLIPGIKTLCGELRGDRQEDTDDFQKQCVDGVNWVIEIYNRISDIIDAGKIHMDKQGMNDSLIELGSAIRNKEDEKIADLLENSVIPFLSDLEAAAKEI